MGYLHTFWNYLRSPKGRHDFMDYIRAAVILAAVMAIIRVMMDMLL
ncbi:MAG TPA: hypothetical protein PKA10_18835 [Selenomonadales bacterium]|nr:hypothetical protein [Selenomonadales bacterium]